MTINKRILDLAGVLKEEEDSYDDDSYLYYKEPVTISKDKKRADGIEIVKIDGKYKIKLRLNGEFTKTLYTVENSRYVPVAILKTMLDNSQYFPALEIVREKKPFLGGKEEMTTKYAGVLVGIKNAITDKTNMPPNQWFEYKMPIDLTFEEIFANAV